MCRATGPVVIRDNDDGTYEITDKIRHRRNCPSQKKKEQPAHLRKKRWRGQEKRAAKAILGRETLRSGAANLDGDARRFREWRVECKRTKKDSYSVPQAVWTKLIKGARSCDERPALFVDIQDGDKRFVLVVEDDKNPTVRYKTLKATTRYGEVLPLTPRARVLSHKEFVSLVQSLEKTENETKRIINPGVEET